VIVLAVQDINAESDQSLRSRQPVKNTHGKLISGSCCLRWLSTKQLHCVVYFSFPNNNLTATERVSLDYLSFYILSHGVMNILGCNNQCK
jgi:hypothetical protein